MWSYLKDLNQVNPTSKSMLFPVGRSWGKETAKAEKGTPAQYAWGHLAEGMDEFIATAAASGR